MLTLRQIRALATAALLGLSLVSPAAGAHRANALARPRASAAQSAQPAHQSRDLHDILEYISTGWTSLTRSMTDCKSVVDPKAPEKSVLYLPANFPVPEAVEQMRRSCSVRVEHLPRTIEKLGQIDASSILLPGLLYLENPYVVPGGRFNEMYGWDSYFIIRGLLRAGKVELARGMVENFFFELDHYGGVLNANRTYYLTRSQPPFLTSMILAVYEAEKASGQDERAALAWLARAYPYAVKDYNLWIHDPHLAGNTGLARYYDFGDGPVPEMADDPGFYRRVASYLLAHPDARWNYLTPPAAGQPMSTLMGPVFSLNMCDDESNHCDPVEKLGLSPDYYKGDRSMRESGFDVAFRFGPYSGSTHHYAPVCLNSLLYKVEKDLERISAVLGRNQELKEWSERAVKRRALVNKYFWNGERGLYFDYDFEHGTQSSYVFITTFYPLWVGAASAEQARAVEKNIKLFEQPGGVAMSQTESKGQWDYPYGWAPTQIIAVEGLRRYEYNDDANRIAYNFLAMILDNFRRDGTIREKYNVVTRSSETAVEAGYHQNVIGFGWTNAVFLEFLHALPEALAARLGAQ
ncbi:MAG TPA: trehalase family glycosidase [Terriglobia bacterium]|nr:trehalase family glycosidase [Terriglobia bacterium]